ncbi:CENP-A multicopy suppressor protein 2 [Fusarium austroafricanum]|uniref:CENP-A multicopy suppressor protein 2 n=1 Tax=Fusarium austroafricanum TaxID=2364996 RepID=A0A8H4K5X1_9HYPO|nr:CENP-A multicopy suppressor protein 2 [Fusarium austroafricanum]
MASQMRNLPQGGWNHNGQMMQQNSEANEAGVQVRPMGLKVHYTFDKEAKVNCLARSTQTLFVQTVPLDDKNSIGIVDLRACLQAVTECSPELGNQESEGDFTIYALDYSEPDTPLVGQGMLSWALDSMRGDWMAQMPKMVTGRVSKNLLSVFGGGNRETLEVKLKFTASSRVLRPEPAMDMAPVEMHPVAMQPGHMQPSPLQPAPLQPTASLPPSRSADTAMISGAAEWSSFIQANPQIGHSAHVSRVASPALSQGAPPTSSHGAPAPPNTNERRDSIGPTTSQTNSGPDVQRIAPMPVPQSATTATSVSRPSSRSSRNRKPPTGRPRGRPRKKPAEGNTSGYEDGTEGEDGGTGPAKKRAKPTKVEKAAPNPFTSGPESLRVTASTAGSLRNFRPVNSNNDTVAGNHLQEVPRAPTPVPEGGPLNSPSQGGPKGPKPRRESSMRKELSAALGSQIPPRPLRALSPSQEDGRSPESPVETPAFSEDSPQDMRSSPPVPRTASFMRSSPPPSSPVLPPMPALPRQTSSFMENETDDLLDEPALQSVRESQSQTQKVMEDVDRTGIPTQVFRMEDGPDGQGLVHIQNFNTPQPTSTPAGPPPSEPVTAKKVPISKPARNPSQKRASNPKPPPRTLAPTPPPTTDAPEKNSPVPATAPSPSDAAQPQGAQSVEPMEDVLFELVRAVSGSSELTTSIETNQSTEGSLPTSKSSTGIVAPKPRPSRPLGRSQSAGLLALPSVPASEPAGPSSLSQSVISEPSRASTEIPNCLRRSKSVSVHKPIAISDPLGPPETYMITNTLPTLSEAPFPQSDFPRMPSSPPSKSNKNQIKKDSIKQRLESAIAAGEMPPFCTNCGAIETPTWRKIWVQEHDGIPQYVEYSEKPGRVTAIEILKRDKDKKPISHRLIKKALGFDDDRSDWSEKLLCNPCGIWMSKYHNHRPQDKWDNSFGHLGQSRKKRGSAGPESQAKRARTKSASVPNPPSEAFPVTDSFGPIEPSSPKQFDVVSMETEINEDVVMQNVLNLLTTDGRHAKGMSQSVPGSTHSRASRGTGTADSPIEMDLDEELGSTRRLLFPSPRKEGTQRILGEINANATKAAECRQRKEIIGKENMACEAHNEEHIMDDDIEALFNSPARPTTPPPKSKADTDSTVFKTPTRPTPSHRPITRSVSRSLRSVRDMLSPNQQALLQRTPTRSPTSVRRSPRLNLESKLESVLDTPLSRTITQLLSEPNFDLANSNLDFSTLPLLDTDPASLADFGNFLSTDGIVPSSPPKDGAMNFTYNGSDNVWAEWGGIEHKSTAQEKEK